jgi:ferredoxin-NADP reductase
VRIGTASGFLAALDGGSVPLRVVRAMRFRPPDDHRRPIVMFAGGSGISPFRSFLQSRAQHADAGETWLFLAARSTAEIPFRDELEQLARASGVQVRYALPREGREPRGIGDAIRAEATPLRRLLGDGAGACAYVCGRGGFAGAVTDALGELVGEERLAQLAADGRFEREVFTTYTVPHSGSPAAFDASAVALHNDAEHGLWVVIDGRVYDVSRFEALHPGGTKVLRGYAGTDATAVYRSLGHDADPSVDALRALYEIGVVRRLDLGAGWAVWIGDGGLEPISLRGLYRRWVSAMYLAVEMENAHRNDLSIRHRATTRGEAPDSVSPFKAELLGEIHPRFAGNYVRGLEAVLCELWEPTSGACSRHEDVRWMRRRLDAARNCAGLGTDVASIDAVNARDAALLREIKSGLRGGVRLFEQHERDVVRGAGDRLLETVRGLAGNLERWYAGG